LSITLTRGEKGKGTQMSNEIDKKELQFGFSGYFVPVEVAFHPYLKRCDKELFGFIKNLSQSKKGCWASNRTLGEWVQLNATSTSSAIARLKKYKFILIWNDTKSGTNIRRIFVNQKYKQYYSSMAKEINDDLLNQNLPIREKYKKIIDTCLMQTQKGPYANPKGALCKIINKRKDNIEDNIEDNNYFLSENNICFSAKNIDNGSSEFPSDNKRILKRRKKKSYPLSLNPFIPKEAKDIISYWNNSGLQKHNNPNTKLYRKIIISIKRLKSGTFFKSLPINGNYAQYKTKKWTYEEILQAISNFTLAATNCDYLPKSEKSKEWLRKQSLPNFLWNEYLPDKTEKSLLLKYFEIKPELAKQSMRPLKDDYPKMTKIIEKVYNEKVFDGVAPQNLPVNIKNSFIKAARRETEYISKLIKQRKIRTYFIQTNRLKAELLVDAALTNLKNPKELRPHYLCSDYMFDDIFPRYLSSQAVLEATN